MCQRIVLNENLLQSFLVILYLFMKTKFNRHVHSDNCGYTIVDTQMVDDLGNNLFCV